MARKKSKLWLNGPKWAKYKSVRFAHSNTLKSPLHTKHKCTPLKGSTPKRIRLFTPPKYTPLKRPTPKRLRLITPQRNSPHGWSYQIVSEDKDTMREDFDVAMEILEKQGLASDFRTFIELVKENQFPLDNISLLLFLETVRFLSRKTTSDMWYWDTTKRFWKTGYRLFHGRFIYFMGWPKSIGQISENICDKGMADPQAARINFAVPSQRILSEFCSNEIQTPKSTSPGILYPVLETLQGQQNTEYMLCADGKKITAGVDSKGGDVDMFGFEDGLTFVESKQQLEQQLLKLNATTELVQSISSMEMSADEKNDILCKVEEAVKVVGLRLKDCRELAFRQKMGLQKFKGMAGENWRDSRFVYVISSIQASLHQLMELLSNGLIATNLVLHSTSEIAEENHNYAANDTIDLSYQQNIITLQEHQNDIAVIESRFLKQRSDLWHALRKSARVTGSTLHNALGLRGLKEKKLHYEKFLEDLHVVESEDVQIRMQHGCDHEQDAIATLVGKFLPVFYPKCVFVEEGCYVINGKNIDVMGIVSPDGSIRSDPEKEALAGIEIKCPWPNDRKVTVHYSLPEYYVCQILAEMKVLQTDTLIYVSYTPESSTFFKVTFDISLWNDIWSEAIGLYDTESPKKPTKTSINTKSIKEKIKQFVVNNVEFLCEIPSCTMKDSGLRSVSSNSYFMQAVEQITNSVIHETLPLTKLENAIEKTKTFVRNSYEISRRRATEVMVWVLTNKNRNSTLEIPCSVPVAYGLKDYKLTSNALRKATDLVLTECSKHGLNILNLSTDGQFIQLMNRDGNGKPLTILQKHKDVWNKTKSLSKQDIIKKLPDVFESYPDRGVIVEQLETGAISVSSKDDILITVRTPKSPTIVDQGPNQSNCEEIHNNSTSLNAAADWLPDSVINILPNSSDTVLQNAVDSITREVNGAYQINGDNETVTQETEFDSTILSHSYDDLTQNEVREGSEAINPMSLEQNKATAHVTLTPEILDKVTNNLKHNPKTTPKWQTLGVADLRSNLSTYEHIQSFRHQDLEVIHESLKEYIPKSYPEFKKYWDKKQKTTYICNLLGVAAPISLTTTRTKTKLKTPPTLKVLSKRALQAKSYPKANLRIGYCAYLFKKELKEWQNDMPFECPVKIEGVERDIAYWFSYPETNPMTGRLLSKSIDCSHNLTHLRVRTSTTGICGISSKAWQECAKSNTTKLTRPFVEDLIDKQNVANARTHFSEEVEEWMKQNGYLRSAKLTRLIRKWYDASDNPGMYATQRIVDLVEMRHFLLDEVDFSKFPPFGRYIKGIPCVTYEGMLIDIDSKIQLHKMTHGYNIRSVGSLAAETTVGVLQAMYPISQVSIKARDVPELVSSVVEIMTYKSNPNRGFFMRTSRSSGVYPNHEGDMTEPIEISEKASDQNIVVPRNHAFDMPGRKTRRKIKFGEVSGPRAPSRGALSVRQHHRKDESKILATKRLGIELQDL